eukprot:5691117-Prymnesium_polylepis.2
MRSLDRSEALSRIAALKAWELCGSEQESYSDVARLRSLLRQYLETKDLDLVRSAYVIPPRSDSYQPLSDEIKADKMLLNVPQRWMGGFYGSQR